VDADRWAVKAVFVGFTGFQRGFAVAFHLLLPTWPSWQEMQQEFYPECLAPCVCRDMRVLGPLDDRVLQIVQHAVMRMLRKASVTESFAVGLKAMLLGMRLKQRRLAWLLSWPVASQFDGVTLLAMACRHASEPLVRFLVDTGVCLKRGHCRGGWYVGRARSCLWEAPCQFRSAMRPATSLHLPYAHDGTSRIRLQNLLWLAGEIPPSHSFNEARQLVLQWARWHGRLSRRRIVAAFVDAP
jgi:hypothetical protein